MSYPIEVVRVVLDTNVIVSALRSRTGASNALLRHVAGGRVVPLATTGLFLEYEAVLKRPEHRLVHGLDDAAVGGFLSALASATEPVEISFQYRPQLRDPDDEVVLEAAVNGRATVLVTHNERDFEPAASTFGIRVLTPGRLLKELIS